ncbi:MAG: hypothetical protein K6D02_07670 [Lachnospiraceae bacterium]|nr:hypothetical protein [Lachnospiraceae bacterium]
MRHLGFGKGLLTFLLVTGVALGNLNGGVLAKAGTVEGVNSKTAKATGTNNTNDSKDDTDTTDDSEKDTKTKVKKGIVIKIGKKEETTEVLTGKIKKKKGNLYFKDSNGKKVKNKFFTYKKNVYHTDKKGILTTGWMKKKGNCYFFNRNSGKLVIGKKAESIPINKKGIAKNNKYNISRVKVFIKAQKVVKSVSKKTDSKATKLYKAYKWMEKMPYKRYRTMEQAKRTNPKDWDVVFANDIFNNHAGCCASESAAFGYLAKACGYKKVTICSDTGHAWMDINGRLYDPLFSESRGFKNNYNAAYTDYRAHYAYGKKLY